MDVEVRIAKEYVVLLKSDYFTAQSPPYGFLACPDNVHWNLSAEKIQITTPARS